jgi:hypothetical protein
MVECATSWIQVEYYRPKIPDGGTCCCANKMSKIFICLPHNVFTFDGQLFWHTTERIVRRRVLCMCMCVCVYLYPLVLSGSFHWRREPPWQADDSWDDSAMARLFVRLLKTKIFSWPRNIYAITMCVLLLLLLCVLWQQQVFQLPSLFFLIFRFFFLSLYVMVCVSFKRLNSRESTPGLAELISTHTHFTGQKTINKCKRWATKTGPGKWRKRLSSLSLSGSI